jgi:hypothetical protein
MKSKLSPLVGLFSLTNTLVNAQTFTWEDKANGQVVADCNGAEPGGQFVWPNNNNWSQDQVIGNNPCPPHAPGFVREPSNWSTPGYPNSSSAVVVINAAPTVDLDVSAEIGTLNISAGNKLRILGYSRLSVHGGTLTNHGTIDLEDGSLRCERRKRPAKPWCAP